MQKGATGGKVAWPFCTLLFFLPFLPPIRFSQTYEFFSKFTYLLANPQTRKLQKQILQIIQRPPIPSLHRSLVQIKPNLNNSLLVPPNFQRKFHHFQPTAEPSLPAPRLDNHFQRKLNHPLKR